jgi:hypothetical protein
MGTVARKRGCGVVIIFLFCLASAGTGWPQAATPEIRYQSVSPPANGQVELAGELEILHQDFQHSGTYLYFLKQTGGARIRLHFGRQPPTNLLTGVRLRVRGIRQADGSLMLASGGSGITQTSGTSSSSTPLPNTFGAQSTLVILVNFQDAPANQPYTVADAQNVVFGTASSFLLENSYHQTWLTGQVVGWYTIATSSTTCDTTSIASYAQSAAVAAGVNLSAYTHYVYAFPQNNNCGWAGSSLIGGSPSQSWINGSGMEMNTVDHELGHALGLWHSHLLDCGAGATIGSNCAIDEYGDIHGRSAASIAALQRLPERTAGLA